MAITPSSDDSVLLRTEGRAAYLTLNRPKAINALTHAMVLRMGEALEAWQADASVQAVVITGAGERGLCAGGDIRAVREAVISGSPRAAAEFWRDEYILNLAIARYPKPYVAIMDGIVMGGGVGVSAHGSVRVVTERSLVAMPETGIGFIPDVGGTYLLSRAPGELGTHLALTGTPVGAGDAVLCGLADHFIPSEDLAAFAEALATDEVATALKSFTAPVPAAQLADQRVWIDECYAADTVEEIVARLRQHPDPAANATAATILTKSPTALKVTLAAVRRARELPDLRAVLEQEFLVSCSGLTEPDLAEGIRAQVVDKDRDPHWVPAALAEVPDSAVARYFSPPREGERHNYLGRLFA
ncbi:enoyl-CoA hydratase/isomerase family protein [Actinospica sp. MGRD01-02]|uniref:3-hydroxyisobutyryl-CoA hydrolase n=1 Tax=Actinospica acidithermotolerans TaxID=2828514 RepID=A0A941IFY3_9ACTN|nr:enoyl-CoA hydratase/isomerase family protein [Actinospica acidithermotolerans]MBR7825539.1 enoyl-CoA hydratase/isomerase family protein [Actinospica acidithermotolerans]